MQAVVKDRVKHRDEVGSGRPASRPLISKEVAMLTTTR